MTSPAQPDTPEARSPLSALRGALVLVATDLSPASDEALLEADRWARMLGGPLVALHVVPVLPRSNMLFPQDVAADASRIMDLTARVSGALAERVAAKTGRTGKDVRLLVESGAPHATIVRKAEELGAGLVVVGSHGAEGFGRRLLGNVADRVVRHAHCPVLVARWQPGKGKILVATDLSDPSFPAIDAGAELAKGTGAELTLLHVVERVDEAFRARAWGGEIAWPDPAPLTSDEVQRRVGDTLRALASNRGIAADVRVMEGSPAAAIVQAAEDLSAELIVVGCHGRTGLLRMLLGSVAERVVAAAPCSVLAVRLAR